MSEQEPLGELIVIKKGKAANANPKTHYLIEVEGDSLKGDGINSGDYVLIKRNADFVDGEIYAVLVDGSNNALKHVSVQDGKYRLWSSNAHYQEEFYDFDRVGLQGMVITRVPDQVDL